MIIDDLLVLVDVPEYDLLRLEANLPFPLEVISYVLQRYDRTAELDRVERPLTLKFIVNPVALLWRDLVLMMMRCV